MTLIITEPSGSMAKLAMRQRSVPTSRSSTFTRGPPAASLLAIQLYRKTFTEFANEPTFDWPLTRVKWTSGPRRFFDLHAQRLRWYDYWLKGVANGAMDGPPVRAFMMGANRWLDLDTWPPDGVAYRPLFLRRGAEATAGALNSGGLSFESPDATEAPDSFTYDPRNPVPSLIVYPQLGPKDHRPVEDGMLTYTSAVLESDLAIAGPVTATLYAASSAQDTDWVVRLCDVWPDGRSISVCDGILRARYRESLIQPTLVTPDHVYQFRVDLWSTAQLFKAGHRLRLHVTSSDFPRYDRNLNTGGPLGTESHSAVAVNTVFHDAARASHLSLPVFALRR